MTINPLRLLLRSSYYQRRVLAPQIAGSDDLGRAVSIISSRWPETVKDRECEDSPIFLFSAGWGSGSTLIQRLISSDKNTLIWGEPHDHGIAIHRLAEMLVPVNDKWPLNNYFQLPDNSKPIQEQWIANFSPPVVALQAAHRSFLQRWLRDPASSSGRNRWGIKEVRLTADHARYLKWLFPRAKFIFLYRDVLDSYRSCKDVKWLSVWPDYPVGKPTAFAHHWKHLLQGFIKHADELNALLIRYEDFVSGKTAPGLIADHLDLPIMDESAIKVRVGARAKRNKSLTYIETAVIRAITDDLRSKLDYC